MIKKKANTQKRKVSILEALFELELIHRDDINVAYIIRLLSNLMLPKKDAEQIERKYSTCEH
jgi:type I restriction enzyme R subunit